MRKISYVVVHKMEQYLDSPQSYCGEVHASLRKNSYVVIHLKEQEVSCNEYS